MKRTPVNSSNLRSIGYDEKRKLLEIEFDEGSVYQYARVPLSVYRSLMSASSHGKYFHAFIKNQYAMTQIL